jgi:glutaredoxin
MKTLRHKNISPLKQIASVFLCFGVLILLVFNQSAQSAIDQRNLPIELYFFYGQGCPHCAKAKPFLESLEKKYPQLKVKSFEVYGDEKNKELFFLLAQAYGREIEGVPTIFIGDKVISGYNELISFQIEQAVQDCIPGVQNEGEAKVLPFQLCPSPLEKLKISHIPSPEESSSSSLPPEESSSREKLISAIILFLILGLIVLGMIKLIKKKKD